MQTDTGALAADAQVDSRGSLYLTYDLGELAWEEHSHSALTFFLLPYALHLETDYRLDSKVDSLLSILDMRELVLHTSHVDYIEVADWRGGTDLPKTNDLP